MYTILATLFTLLVSIVETQAYQSELTDVIQQNISTTLDKLNTTSGGSLKIGLRETNFSEILALAVDNVSPTASKVNNAWVLGVMKLMGGVLLAGLLFFWVCSLFMGIPQSNMKVFSRTIITLLIFTAIGIVEALFFINIASKYIPTMPSLLVTTVISTLRTTPLPTATPNQ